MWATPPEQAVVPPGTGPFSHTTTEAPVLRAPAAAERAAAPLPTTTTSCPPGAPLRGARGGAGRRGGWANPPRSATRCPSDGRRALSAIVDALPRPRRSALLIGDSYSIATEPLDRCRHRRATIGFGTGSHRCAAGERRGTWD